MISPHEDSLNAYHWVRSNLIMWIVEQIIDAFMIEQASTDTQSKQQTSEVRLVTSRSPRKKGDCLLLRQILLLVRIAMALQMLEDHLYGDAFNARQPTKRDV